jgi:hypothetical protein
MLAEAVASLAAVARKVFFAEGDGSGSLVAGSLPFLVKVSCGAVAFALGDSPEFEMADFLGTIFFRVEGEADAVDRGDALEGDLWVARILSLVVSGSGGTVFVGLVDAFVLVTEVADVRLGLLAEAVTLDAAVAVVLTLTVETVDETELRRGRGARSPENSTWTLWNVDTARIVLLAKPVSSYLDLWSWALISLVEKG